MPDPIRLVVSQAKPVHACGTCKYYVLHRDMFDTGVTYSKCLALSMFADNARRWGEYCGPDGRFWEPKPPRQHGAIVRAWRWLVGGSDG